MDINRGQSLWECEFWKTCCGWKDGMNLTACLHSNISVLYCTTGTLLKEISKGCRKARLYLDNMEDPN